MRVEVEAPAIDGDTVIFRWRQTESNPFQQENVFFFRYEGLDLAHFAPELFSEVFLALQLKVFAAYARPVEIVLPHPAPRPTVDFWCAYHDADHVSVSPVTETPAYEPAIVSPAPGAGYAFAVFFGGGKDSMLAASLLRELYGADEIVLIQYIGPLRRDQALTDRLRQRQERLKLGPARQELGVATRRVWTDYQAQFRRAGYHARPHIELYTAGALPLLLAMDCSVATFSYSWNCYALRTSSDGQSRFRFPRSRPEVLAAQSAHYRQALGANLTVTNPNMLVSNFGAYRVLAERYPAAFHHIVTCSLGGADDRWCGNCWKCAAYALYGLSLGIIDPRFPYDSFFARSPHIQAIVGYAFSAVDRSMFGNAPWQSFVTSSTVYMGLCHALANPVLDRTADAAKLGGDARGNLAIFQALFGNQHYPSVEMLPAAVVDRFDHEVIRRVAALVAEHLPVADALPEPHLLGNERVRYDFDVVMPTRLTKVAHLRDC